MIKYINEKATPSPIVYSGDHDLDILVAHIMKKPKNKKIKMSQHAEIHQAGAETQVRNDHNHIIFNFYDEEQDTIEGHILTYNEFYKAIKSFVDEREKRPIMPNRGSGKHSK